MPCSRRRLLGVAAASLTLPTAGCRASRPATPASVRGVLAVEAVDAAPGATGDGTAVRLSDLPEAERDLLREAIDDEFRLYCGSPETIRSLADRFGDTTLLRAAGERYAVYLRIGDEVRVGGTDPPEGTPGFCF